MEAGHAIQKLFFEVQHEAELSMKSDARRQDAIKNSPD